MTNLTDKWKKGELPSGWYWVEGCRAEGIYAYTAEYLNNIDRPEDGERIVEKVPSYEEWQAKLEENTKLKERNDSLNNRDINLCRIANGIRDENFALKELLKKAKESMTYRAVRESSREMADKLHEEIKQINQVLGEQLYLRDLPPDMGNQKDLEIPECGLFCDLEMQGLPQKDLEQAREELLNEPQS